MEGWADTRVGSRETSALLMMDAPTAIARNSHTRSSSSASLARSLSSTPRIAASSLHVEDALVVRCTTRGSSFVVVTATNKAPRNHTIAIDVPNVHVATTKLVRLKDNGARVIEVTEERDDFHVNSGNALLNTFDFEERFHIDTVPDEVEDKMNNEDEDSLFIPALRRVSNRYVRLQPGERFNFVYEVVPKGVFSPPKSFDPACGCKMEPARISGGSRCRAIWAAVGNTARNLRRSRHGAESTLHAARKGCAMRAKKF